MAGERTRALHAYWQGLNRGPGTPLADDFKLMDIYKLASRLLLIDAVHADDGRLRHRYRYVGTKIVSYRVLRGLKDHTGTFADEAPRYYSGDYLTDSYQRCTVEAVPVLTIGSWQGASRSGRFERLAVPLFDSGGDVIRLAVMVDRFEKE